MGSTSRSTNGGPRVLDLGQALENLRKREGKEIILEEGTFWGPGALDSRMPEWREAFLK